MTDQQTTIVPQITLESRKARAFDILRQIEQLQFALRQENIEIQKLEQSNGNS